MGLRSRQRRLAGGAPSAFDIETNQRVKQSLQDHLQASRNDVDAFNLTWKRALGMGGLLLAMYEAAAGYQLLAASAGIVELRVVVVVLIKALAMAALIATRKYVQSGASAVFGASVVLSGGYALLWTLVVGLLGVSLSTTEASPLPVVYFVVAHGALRLIGDNTKAEVARATQLEKLERALNSGKHQ
ncbi:hypothetical protein P43SY_008205 [Pythium insidiosum]|uniref:Transmembrane protein n=1 Tax=Pythium insidiosum TaxID=114742 RepID=A0AAD5Q520_PYTIN|nr:hypothetical protein P43SY_008205 [Pythium insidiosum]